MCRYKTLKVSLCALACLLLCIRARTWYDVALCGVMCACALCDARPGTKLLIAVGGVGTGYGIPTGVNQPLAYKHMKGGGLVGVRSAA